MRGERRPLSRTVGIADACALKGSVQLAGRARLGSSSPRRGFARGPCEPSPSFPARGGCGLARLGRDAGSALPSTASAGASLSASCAASWKPCCRKAWPRKTHRSAEASSSFCIPSVSSITYPNARSGRVHGTLDRRRRRLRLRLLRNPSGVSCGHARHSQIPFNVAAQRWPTSPITGIGQAKP